MPRCRYATPPRLEAVPGFEPGSARPVAAAGRSGVSAGDCFSLERESDALPGVAWLNLTLSFNLNLCSPR